MFDDAVAFLRRQKGVPFYLNLWIKKTHLAHEPSEESLKEHAHLDEQQRVYSAVVADGDKGVGKVLAALRELGLEQNTLVIFSSDNGPENTSAGKEKGEGYGGFYKRRQHWRFARAQAQPLRRRRAAALPRALARPHPGGPGEQDDVRRGGGFAATVCAAAGVKLPGDYRPDGENMLPVFLGAEGQRTTPLFWDWNGKDKPKDCWPRWAMRAGDWKLVADDRSRAELYHSSDDWAEAKNVAKENPAIVAKLTAQREAWKASLPKEVPPQFISKEGRGRKRTPPAAKNAG